jgi:hypothetical protein
MREIGGWRGIRKSKNHFTHTFHLPHILIKQNKNIAKKILFILNTLVKINKIKQNTKTRVPKSCVYNVYEFMCECISFHSKQNVLRQMSQPWR